MRSALVKCETAFLSLSDKVLILFIIVYYVFPLIVTHTETITQVNCSDHEVNVIKTPKLAQNYLIVSLSQSVHHDHLLLEINEIKKRLIGSFNSSIF